MTYHVLWLYLQAKNVLTQPFVLASLLYSLVISYSLSVRGNQMSLVNGRPLDSVAHTFLAGPDKWNTTSHMDLLIASLAFLIILLTHIYLILHLMMRRPAGAPAMQRLYPLPSISLSFSWLNNWFRFDNDSFGVRMTGTTLAIFLSSWRSPRSCTTFVIWTCLGKSSH
jgi:hypothetical protein